MPVLSPGQMIRDTYEVERYLGEGAFAEVYRVRHRFLGRQAMKVFKLRGMTLTEIEEALSEALLLSRIGHPNIIRVFDANTIATPGDRLGFFTMELVPGGNLDDFWKSHGSRLVPVETTVDIIRQICRGLSVAHSESPPVVHRDIKPQNVLIGYDGSGLRVRIGDFGLAKRVNPLSLLASARGTPCFKAPEVFAQDGMDSCASDVWSIGVTLHVLLTDRMPFEVDTDGRIDPRLFDSPPIAANRLNLQVNEDLQQILDRALSIDPRKRYSTAMDMLSELERWTVSDESRPDLPIPADSESRFSSKGPIVFKGSDDPHRIVARAIAMAAQPGKLMDAADLLEAALNRDPDLRPNYESRLQLWRRGVTM